MPLQSSTGALQMLEGGAVRHRPGRAGRGVWAHTMQGMPTCHKLVSNVTAATLSTSQILSSEFPPPLPLASASLEQDLGDLEKVEEDRVTRVAGTLVFSWSTNIK